LHHRPQDLKGKQVGGRTQLRRRQHGTRVSATVQRDGRPFGHAASSCPRKVLSYRDTGRVPKGRRSQARQGSESSAGSPSSARKELRFEKLFPLEVDVVWRRIHRREESVRNSSLLRRRGGPGSVETRVFAARRYRVHGPRHFVQVQHRIFLRLDPVPDRGRGALRQSSESTQARATGVVPPNENGRRRQQKEAPRAGRKASIARGRWRVG
jgi:hypothetical protein